MDVKLDIIVPVYKVEDYISRCLTSILEQSYTDFDLILIDDGSPDRCGEIIDDYVKRDGRIVAIHQKNKGTSGARNSGLKVSQGIYIGFVDPDDWICPDMYEQMIKVIEDRGSDIVCCSWNDVYENGEIVGYFNSNILKNMNHEEFINHLFDLQISITGSVCNKLFVRKRINGLFPVGKAINEDSLFLVQYALSVEQASFCDSRLYNIFSRKNSATRRNYEKVAEGIPVWEEILSLVAHESRKTRMLAERLYLDKCMAFSNFSGLIGQKAKHCLSRYMKDNFIQVIGNSEIYWKTKLMYIKTMLETNISARSLSRFSNRQ